MAKFYGIVGYVTQEETTPGVWTNKVIEKPYRGDILRAHQKLSFSEHLNGSVNISNEFSIVADPYANANSHYIRYVKYKGVCWDVIGVEMQYPRLILSVGGVYNGEQA